MKRVPKLLQLRRIFQAPATDVVHFHRGPQGQPAACHDPKCPVPRLTV